MFQKTSARTWAAQSEHYTWAVERNGHCGYYMAGTHKTTGEKTFRAYGKHFKALESWIEKFEGWAIAPETQLSYDIAA